MKLEELEKLPLWDDEDLNNAINNLRMISEGVDTGTYDKLNFEDMQRLAHQACLALDSGWKKASAVIKELHESIKKGVEYSLDNEVPKEVLNEVRKENEELISIHNLHYEELRNILDVGIDVTIPWAINQLKERVEKAEKYIEKIEKVNEILKMEVEGWKTEVERKDEFLRKSILMLEDMGYEIKN